MYTVNLGPDKSLAVALAWAVVGCTGSATVATGAQWPELLKPLGGAPYSRQTTPPDFAGKLSDGRALTLTSLRGKVIFLNFWASWCVECRVEMPAIERVHREFSARGLAVIGINARENVATIRDYARQQQLSFPLLTDPDGKINSAYGVIGLPTSFIISRSGRAIALAVGSRDWNGTKARELFGSLLDDRTDDLSLK